MFFDEEREYAADTIWWDDDLLFTKWLVIRTGNYGVDLEITVEYTCSTGDGLLYNLDHDGWDDLGLSKETIDYILNSFEKF